MGEEEKKQRETVFLWPRVTKEINDIYYEAHGTTYGAIQETLERGAELALIELRLKKEGRIFTETDSLRVPLVPESVYDLTYVLRAVEGLEEIKRIAAESKAVLESGIAANRESEQVQGDDDADFHEELDDTAREPLGNPKKVPKPRKKGGGSA